jgi:primosomal replication protein N
MLKSWLPHSRATRDAGGFCHPPIRVCSHHSGQELHDGEQPPLTGHALELVPFLSEKHSANQVGIAVLAEKRNLVVGEAE